MKLSDGEKLIAFMLADIMSAQGIHENIDPELVKSAIAGDDMWALNWKYNSLFHSDGPSDEIVQETADIMTMCRVMENSISELDDPDSLPDNAMPVFVGFDGNEEPHYGVATMLVEKLDRFTEWADRDLNSHHSTLGRYRSMKRTYDEQPRGQFGSLELPAILEVLSAR